MKLLKHITGILFSRMVLAFAVAIICADLLLETFGLPDSTVKWLCGLSRHCNVFLKVSQVRCGVLRGLVLDDVSIKIDTAAGRESIELDELSLRLSLLDLFNGFAWIENMRTSNVRIIHYDDAGERLYMSDIEHVTLAFDASGHGRIDFTSKFNGIEIRTAAEVFNADKMSFDSKGSGAVYCRNKELCILLEKVSASLKKCDFGSDDAFMDLSVSLDCIDLGNMGLDGHFTLGDAVFSGVLVSKLRGKLGIKEGVFSLNDVLWILGRNETLRASAEYDIKGKTLLVNASGQVIPSTVIQLAGIEHSGLDALMKISSPVHFAGSLPRTSLDLKQMRPSVKCEFGEMSLDGLGITKGIVEAECVDGRIIFNTIDILFNPAGTEFLRGSASFSPNAGTMSFDARGKADCRRFCHELGLSVPEGCLQMFDRTTEFTVKLDESPFNPVKWKAHAKLSHPQMTFNDWALHRISTEFALDNGKLTLLSGTFAMDADAEPVAYFSGNVDLNWWLDHDRDKTENLSISKPIEVRHTIKLLADADGKLEDAVDWRGCVKINPENGQVALDGKGNGFFDRFVKYYMPGNSNNDIDVWGAFYSGGTPAEFSAVTPWIDLKSGLWSVSGTIEAQGGGFSTFAIKEGICDYKVTQDAALFKNLRGITAEGYKVSLDMEFAYAPFTCELRNIRLEGDPEIAVAFIFSNEAKNIYKRIWHDVAWTKENPPLIQIPSLKYQSGGMDSAWTLDITGTLEAKNVRYAALDISEVHLGINLALPYSLNISPANIKVDKGTMNGECSLSFGNSPQCVFSVNETTGIIDPGKLLTAINPQWTKTIGKLEFGEKSRLTCKGAFYLDGPSELQMSGTITSPHCGFRNMTADDVEASWGYENNRVQWNVVKAKFMDGDLKTTGIYDVGTDAGDLLVICNKMSWAQFAQLISGTENVSDLAAMPGVLSGNCRLSFYRNWAGRPYHVEGGGRLSLREADIWRVPLMKQLGYMLELTTFKWLVGKKSEDGGFGKITEIDADLLFQGTRLSVPNFSSNGTIIALSGNGEYSWETDKLYFLVSGEALKEISVLSFLLKPLSWAFQAELTGTRKSNKWKMRTALRKVFSSD